MLGKLGLLQSIYCRNCLIIDCLTSDICRYEPLPSKHVFCESQLLPFQYLELLTTHQNKLPRCLSILWCLGVGGNKDFRSGLRGTGQRLFSVSFWCKDKHVYRSHQVIEYCACWNRAILIRPWALGSTYSDLLKAGLPVLMVNCSIIG